jgi:hypothetical protein
MDVRIGQMDATIRAEAPAPTESTTRESPVAAGATVQAEARPPALEADRRLRARLTPDERRHEVAK